VTSDAEIGKGRSDWRYYFDDSGNPFSSRLGLLAVKVWKDSGSAVQCRLERLYTNIFIDEFQDLAGNDRAIIELLFRSKIDTFVTGDVRQFIMLTSASDQLKKAENGAGAILWARRMQRAGLCEFTESPESRRFVPMIGRLADRVFENNLGLQSTTSSIRSTNPHCGIFLVRESLAQQYVETVTPLVLRYSIAVSAPKAVEVLTFGDARGLTRDHALIVPTAEMTKWINSAGSLNDRTAARLYIGITRAKFSLAFVVPDSFKLRPDSLGEEAGMTFWDPLGF